MEVVKNKSKSFNVGLKKLGFFGDDYLFFADSKKKLPDVEISFHIETAKFIHKEITAVFLRKQLNGSYKPQVYLFDFTDIAFSEQTEDKIADIQRKVWSSGEVPLACFFFNTEIKIVDCTKHVNKELKPEYLTNLLLSTDRVNELYNEQFAVKIKTGIFWEQEELEEKFSFKNSAYDILIHNIRKITERLSLELKKVSEELVNKIIVQSILIKYLEETSDEEGKKLLTEKYFRKYDNSNSFSDVLKKGKFIDLLSDLNRNFNGNVFKWEIGEQEQLAALDIGIVADLLATSKKNLNSPQVELFGDWRYFEFKYIPVELISRLYEEFLGENKKDKGLFYTPAHLAKLLVEECLPLKSYKDIDLTKFKLLDPACGSGIFLVTAFKRLVQIWRLQNKLSKPNIDDLKKILRNIYGIDKEEQAVMLSSFSLCLALCNELKPIEVINKLKFDDLTKENLVHSDFFLLKNIQNKKFDLIIGNPPFVRAAISEYSNTWLVNDKKVKIPQGQIALKFLSESFPMLKENGLVCLIIKASGLLYNSTSFAYKKALFSNYNVVQVLDFTTLARNKSLWDNGADVATAAIFVRNNKPDLSKNILHLTFRRTKATKERIVFEIDDYDLHFVNRQTAVNNEFIWKSNLLGGGRIKNLIDKVQTEQSLEDFLIKYNSIIEEGFEIGSKQNLSPEFIYNIPFLPTVGINENGITYELLSRIGSDIKFSKIPLPEVFNAPNLIIWENIGVNRFPIFYNDKSFSFKRRLISIKSLDNDVDFLNNILDSFKKHYGFYKFYLITTSSETLINRNNTFLLRDLKNIPFLGSGFEFSVFDKNTINDCIEFHQDFFIHGERSKALRKIRANEFESILSNYGIEFSRALNSVYATNGSKFRLSDVIQLDGTSLIATVFRYDNKKIEPLFHEDFTKLDIKGLTNNEISAHLSVKRIIKLYPQEDTIVFIKPNQYRYWLSLMAYRDADKCFSDFQNQIEG